MIELPEFLPKTTDGTDVSLNANLVDLVQNLCMRLEDLCQRQAVKLDALEKVFSEAVQRDLEKANFDVQTAAFEALQSRVEAINERMTIILRATEMRESDNGSLSQSLITLTARTDEIGRDLLALKNVLFDTEGLRR